MGLFFFFAIAYNKPPDTHGTPVCLSGIPRDHFTLLPMSQMFGFEASGRNIAFLPSLWATLAPFYHQNDYT